MTNNVLQTCFPCFLRARVSRQQHLLIWGGGDWLEPVTGALEFDIFGPGMGGGGMGWSGSCRRGSGAGSLEFDIWFCDSRLMVIWRAAMSWGRMAADENGGGGIAAVRLLPPFSQTTAAAAGPSGGKFGRCRSIWRLPVYLAASLATAGPFGGKFGHCRAVWRQVWSLQVYLAASFGRCRAVARPLHSPLF